MSENKKIKAVSNVVRHPSAKAGADARIEPLDGWQVHSPYGVLKSYSGVDLVRLEDIHSWMYAKGIPPNDAVRSIFSPFYMACLDADDGGGTEALALPGELYAVNAQSYPNALFIDEKRSRNESVRFLVGAFPELGHVRFPNGSIGALVYSMAEGALRVWRGNADISTDHLAVLKQCKARASDEEYSIHWPKDDDLRKLLGRLAVPVETAYELWGYGRLAEAEVITPKSRERQPKVLVKDSALDWDGKQLYEKQNALKLSGTKAYTKQLEVLSGLNDTEIRRRIRAHKASMKNPFNGLTTATSKR